MALNAYSGQGPALVVVLDVFFEEKVYITAPEWRNFCSPTVPLMRTDKFTYKNSESFNAQIEIAHFGSDILRNAKVNYSIKDEYGRLFRSGCFNKTDIPFGNINIIGNLNITLNDIKEARKLNLEINIEGTEYINNWDFWVYPDKTDISQGDIYITDSLDIKAYEILEKGGNVLITAAGKINFGKEVIQYFTPAFWNTSWFKMRPPHTTGIYVYNNHPVFKSFPTEYHSNLQWWELINRAQVMQFSDFPESFQPLVQNIDTWFISRKIGMLFEANVLNGKLMMTTLDIKSDPENRIVARQMYKSILDYMNSDQFRPHYYIDPALIENLYLKVAGTIDSYTNALHTSLSQK